MVARHDARAPRVSIVVPSWTGEVGRLIQSLETQTFRDFEIEVVQGVSPAARARNVGAARTTGPILLFVDDDAYFGHPEVVENLVAVLDRHPEISVAGPAQLASPSLGRFQRAVANQVPRMVSPVLAKDTENNPPLYRYGFTAITTTCCAVRREAYEQAGGFDDDLPTGGEDTDFFFRLRRHGARFVDAAKTWVYHDPPTNLRDLVRKSFWYGVGHALEARKEPGRHMNLLRLDRKWVPVLLPLAIPLFPFALVLHVYFEPSLRVRVGFRPLKTLSSYAVLWGYIRGWYWGAPRSTSDSYRGKPGAA